ncbi:hypothetical protein WG66_010897 [Moniliophthora roreri]|nr:hypothetical protein WG66_010897 [Moniliophthora roreri]
MGLEKSKPRTLKVTNGIHHHSIPFNGASQATPQLWCSITNLARRRLIYHDRKTFGFGKEVEVLTASVYDINYERGIRFWNLTNISFKLQAPSSFVKTGGVDVLMVGRR